MNGFAVALQPENLLFAFIGCLVGTLVGVLPGIGPSGATAILIPVTFILPPTPAIIMLSAIYYGTQYGGTITSVLVNVPGEVGSIMTCIDGHEMAKQGRAGAALAVAAIGSFFAGGVATLGMVLLALPLANVALQFGPPEFFGLMVMGLCMVTGLAGKSLMRALLAALVGLMVSMVGMDPALGSPRLTFGQLELMKGFGIVPVVMGMFGIGELMLSVEEEMGEVLNAKMTSLLLSWEDVKASTWPIIRGTIIGFFGGLVPGVGVLPTTIGSYVIEKKMAKDPSRFGHGAIEGVAGPEAANNAAAGGAMIPLFTLGIPCTATMAVLTGAFMMNGLAPGPLLFTEHADFVWGVIASMYIGNVMLVVLNLPLIPLWVAVLRIPYSILFAVILGFCVVGAYSLDGSAFDVGVMAAFGVVGWLCKKLDFPTAPLALTLVLGPMMEQGLRRALQMSDGDYSIFFTRPISAVLLTAAAAFVLFSTMRMAGTLKGDKEV